MSGDDQIDFDKLIGERAVKELYQNIKQNDAIILTSFPQYTVDDVEDMSAGDYDYLLSAATSVQAHRDIMSLMVAIAAQDRKMAKRLFASLEKIANKS